jgi:DNA topoisomerase-1
MLWKLLRQKLNRNGKSFLNPELLSIKAQEASIRPDMSRHTVNIDRDQARLYDLIWKEL